jgi:hypothetical protein
LRVGIKQFDSKLNWYRKTAGEFVVNRFLRAALILLTCSPLARVMAPDSAALSPEATAAKQQIKNLFENNQELLSKQQFQDQDGDTKSLFTIRNSTLEMHTRRILWLLFNEQTYKLDEKSSVFFLTIFSILCHNGLITPFVQTAPPEQYQMLKEAFDLGGQNYNKNWKPELGVIENSYSLLNSVFNHISQEEELHFENLTSHIINVGNMLKNVQKLKESLWVLNTAQNRELEDKDNFIEIEDLFKRLYWLVIRKTQDKAKKSLEPTSIKEAETKVLAEKEELKNVYFTTRPLIKETIKNMQNTNKRRQQRKIENLKKQNRLKQEAKTLENSASKANTDNKTKLLSQAASAKNEIKTLEDSVVDLDRQIVVTAEQIENVKQRAKIRSDEIAEHRERAEQGLAAAEANLENIKKTHRAAQEVFNRLDVVLNARDKGFRGQSKETQAGVVVFGVVILWAGYQICKGCWPTVKAVGKYLGFGKPKTNVGNAEKTTLRPHQLAAGQQA